MAKITLQPGKAYTYTGNIDKYTLVVGELLDGGVVSPDGDVPTLRYGIGAPGPSLGKEGDVYIDTSNTILYTRGPLGWDSGVTFRGADGNDGAPGSSGSPGVNGTDGLDGTSPISGFLTNETQAIPATNAGVLLGNLSSAGGEFIAFRGDDQLTSGVTYQVSLDGTNWSSAGTPVTHTSGLIAQISSLGAYTISGEWNTNSDSVVFYFRAAIGSASLRKTYKIIKSKGGRDSKLLSLNATALAFSLDGQGAFKPTSQTIAFTAFFQNYSQAEISGSSWRVERLVSGSWIESLDGDGEVPLYSTSEFEEKYMDADLFNVARGGIEDPSNSVRVIVTAPAADLNDDGMVDDPLIDSVTIVALEGGADAPSGLLSNESITLRSDDEGYILPEDLTGAYGTFTVLLGGQAVEGVQFFIEEPTTGDDGLPATDGSPVVRNSNGLQITLDKFGEYELSLDETDRWTGTSAAFVLKASGIAGSLFVEKIVNVTKSVGGANAKIVLVTTDTQYFFLDADGDPQPASQTITWTATVQNFEGTPAIAWSFYRLLGDGTWQLIPDAVDGTNFTQVSDTVVQVTYDQYIDLITVSDTVGTQLRVRAEVDGYADEVSVLALQNGPRGLQGEDGAQGVPGPAGSTLSGLLSNEVHVVASDGTGTVVDSALLDATGRFQVYYGTILAQQSFTVTYQVDDGTGTWVNAGTVVRKDGLEFLIESDGDYFVSNDSTATPPGWDREVDQVTFDVRAVVDTGEGADNPVIEKSFTITKSKSGALLRLVSDRPYFTKGSSTTFFPSEQSIRFTTSKQNIPDGITYVWKVYKYSTSASPPSWELKYNSSVSSNTTYIDHTAGDVATMNLTQYGATVGTDTSATIKVSVDYEGIVDEQSVLVVADGASSLGGILSNEVHAVTAESDGTVIDMGDATGDFKVYVGTDEIESGVDYYVYDDADELQTTYTDAASNLTITIGNDGFYSVTQGSGGWNTAVDAVTFTLRAEYQGASINKKFTIGKAKGGANAMILSLVCGKQFFTYDADGSSTDGSPQSTTITASLKNFPAGTVASWRAYRGSETTPLTGATDDHFTIDGVDGNVITISQEQFDDARGTASSIRVEAYVEDEDDDDFGDSDIITIALTRDGANGESPISGYLSNETHTVQADDVGEVTDLGGADGNFSVFLGLLQLGVGITPAVDFTVDGGAIDTDSNYHALTTSGLKLRINRSTGAYEVTENPNWSASSKSVTFNLIATINSAGTIEKSYTITKSLGGASAQIVTLNADRFGFSFDGLGEFSPTNQTVTFTATLANIAGSPTWTVECLNTLGQTVTGDALTQGPTGEYTITGNVLTINEQQYNRIVETKKVGTVNVRVTASALASDGSTLSDSMTIGIISDGAQGAAGAAGAAGISGMLTNENHTISVTSNGTYSARNDLTHYISGAGGFFDVYDGTSKVNSTSYTQESQASWLYTIDGGFSGSVSTDLFEPGGAKSNRQAFIKSQNGLVAHIDRFTGQYFFTSSAGDNTATRWSTNRESFTFKSTKKADTNVVISKAYSISKTTGGTIRLSGPSSFTANSTGVATAGFSYTFTAIPTNCTGSTRWEVTKSDYSTGVTTGISNTLVSPQVSGNTLTIPATDITTWASLSTSAPNNSLIIRVKSDNEIQDFMTFTGVKAGAAGANGQPGVSPIMVYLTNEIDSISAGGTGVVTTAGEAYAINNTNGFMRTNQGTTQLSAVTHSIDTRGGTLSSNTANTTFGSYSYPTLFVTSSGLILGLVTKGSTSTINDYNGYYFIKSALNWTADTETFTITAATSGTATPLSKSFTVTKTMQPTLISLSADSQFFRMNATGQAISSSDRINFNATKIGFPAGDTTPINWRMYGVSSNGTETLLGPSTAVTSSARDAVNGLRFNLFGTGSTIANSVSGTITAAQFTGTLGNYASLRLAVTAGLATDYVTLSPSREGLGVDLTYDGAFFKVNAIDAYNPSSQTLNFAVTPVNMTGSQSWRVWRLTSATNSGSSNSDAISNTAAISNYLTVAANNRTATMSESQFAAALGSGQSVKVEVIGDTESYKDSVVISKVKEGLGILVGEYSLEKNLWITSGGDPEETNALMSGYPDSSDGGNLLEYQVNSLWFTTTRIAGVDGFVTVSTSSYQHGASWVQLGSSPYTYSSSGGYATPYTKFTITSPGKYEIRIKFVVYYDPSQSASKAFPTFFYVRSSLDTDAIKNGTNPTMAAPTTTWRNTGTAFKGTQKTVITAIDGSGDSEVVTHVYNINVSSEKTFVVKFARSDTYASGPSSVTIVDNNGSSASSETYTVTQEPQTMRVRLLSDDDESFDTRIQIIKIA
jgi:hypothetical protein